MARISTLIAGVVAGATGPTGPAGATGATGASGATTTISNGTSNLNILASGGAIFANTAGTNAVTIDASQNVGIGTTSPSYKLDILTGAGGVYAAQFGNGTAAQGMRIVTGMDSTSSAITTAGGTRLIQFDGTNNVTQFYTNATERMRISSGGNVGIATTNPTSALEIYRANSTTGSLTDTSLMLSTSATTGRKVNIGFGLGGGIANTLAATIGYEVMSGTGAGYGDIFFSTRNTTADSVPTERMRIDSSGRVTTPYQPAFAVSKNAGASGTLASDAVLDFGFVLSNRGSHYSTSTNRFTAPVAGHYMFCVHLYHNNTAGNMPNGATSRVMIKKNGTQYSNGTDAIPHAFVQGNGSDMTSSTSIILDLAVNDYVTVAVRNGQTACYYGGHSHFYGYLLG